MSEKKIVVPEGMSHAAWTRMKEKFPEVRGVEKLDFYVEAAFEGALRWLSENPIVPTEEQRREISTRDEPLSFNYICTEWQRRMFIEPLMRHADIRTTENVYEPKRPAAGPEASSLTGTSDDEKGVRS